MKTQTMEEILYECGKYFPFGKIFSLDIYDKTALQENE